MPKSDGGPVATTGPAAKKITAATKPQDLEQRSAPRPVQRAVGLAPAGSRVYWAWIVGRCMYCTGSHLHRGGRSGGLRRAGCGRGEYRVVAK